MRSLSAKSSLRSTLLRVGSQAQPACTEICEKLRVRLTGEQQNRLTRRHTEDPAAYQLYLKGRYYWNQRTQEGMRRAVDYFSKAIEQDPSYARAYTGLGDGYAMLSIYNALPPKASFPKAKAAQQRALEIDADLAEAHAALGFAHLYYDFDRAVAERALRRALDLNPGYASAHQWLGFVLGLSDRMEESIAELRLAQQLDPFSASINVTAAPKHNGSAAPRSIPVTAFVFCFQ